jgi:hypothetical protein
MIAYLALGLVLLAALVLAAQWFAHADPARMARALRWTVGAAIVAVAIFLAATGRLAGALAAIAALAPLLLRWRALWNRVKSAAGPAPGKRSTVETARLRMILDHDSGALDGEVLGGKYRGRRLGDLDRAALEDLLAECRANNPQGAALLEAYLDRRFGPGWRGAAQGEAGAGASARPGFAAAMTREEAYEILGLEPGAGGDEVKAAYHRLMMKLHPDQGGSTFLAAKINQAHDMLLGQRP